MKKIFITALLGLFTSFVYAASPNIVEMGTNNKPCHCFPNDIDNINKTHNDNLSISKNTGQSIQFIAYHKDAIQSLQIDELALTQAVNDYGKMVGNFFKKRPALKGTFITYVNYFPGYPKPFKMPPVPNIDTTTFNKIISEESHCNTQNVCGALLFTDTRFIDDSGSINFNSQYKQDFIKEVSPTLKNIKPVYFKNTMAKLNVPVSFFVVMGTNGQEVPKDKILQLFNIKQ